MRCPDREFWVNVDLIFPFFGKLAKAGKIGKFSKKNEKGQYNHVYTIKIHVLAKFNEEIMIFNKIRGHLVTLTFYRAQTRHSYGPLRKRATKFEVEKLDTTSFHRIRLNMMKLKVKKC